MSHRNLAAVAAAIVVAAYAAAPAMAQVKVSNLRVSTSDGGGPLSVLPSGTTTAWVMFDYTGASQTTASVILEGFGIAGIVSKAQTLTGSGSASVSISGAEVFTKLVDGVDERAAQASAATKLAATQESGRQQRISDVVAATTEIHRSLDILEGTGPDSSRTAQIKAVRDAATDLQGMAEEALALGFDRQADMKARAEAMRPAAEKLASAGADLAEGSNAVGQVALPDTGEQGELTIQLRVETGAGAGPAASVEFRVHGSAPAPPSGTSGAPSAGGPGVSNTGGTAAPTTAGGPARQPTPTTARTQGGSTDTSGSRSGSTGGSTTGSGSSGAQAPRVPPGQAAGSAAATRPPSGLAGAPGDANAAATEPGVVAVDGSTGQEGGPAAPPVAGVAESLPGALPTWTVAADGGARLAQVPPSVPVGGGATRSGRAGDTGNLAVLVLGIAALVGVALWMRRRMI